MDLVKALADLRQEHKALCDAIAILEDLARVRNQTAARSAVAEFEAAASASVSPAKRRGRPPGRKHGGAAAGREG